MSKNKEIRILEIIEKEKSISVNDLVKRAGLSHTSVRRYLSKLEDDKMINRSYGMASVLDDAITSKPYYYKAAIAKTAKEAVGKYAANLIKRGKLIYLDSGTSIYPIAKFINDKSINVVTANLPAAEELAAKGIRVFVLPGYINVRGASVYSEETYKHIENMYFDQCFVSTTSISKEKGFGTNEEISTRIKKKILENSEECFILADKTKYKKESNHFFGDLYSDIKIIVDDLDNYLEKGANIITVIQ